MTLILRDWATRQRHEFPDDTTCACCGAGHDPSRRATRLLIDHTWKPDGTYISTVLCGMCNVSKNDLPYVSFGDECWYPGMAPGARVLKPPVGQRRRLSTKYRCGRVVCGTSVLVAPKLHDVEQSPLAPFPNEQRHGVTTRG